MSIDSVNKSKLLKSLPSHHQSTLFRSYEYHGQSPQGVSAKHFSISPPGLRVHKNGSSYRIDHLPPEVTGVNIVKYDRPKNEQNREQIRLFHLLRHLARLMVDKSKGMPKMPDPKDPVALQKWHCDMVSQVEEMATWDNRISKVKSKIIDSQTKLGVKEPVDPTKTNGIKHLSEAVTETLLAQRKPRRTPLQILDSNSGSWGLQNTGIEPGDHYRLELKGNEGDTMPVTDPYGHNVVGNPVTGVTRAMEPDRVEPVWIDPDQPTSVLRFNVSTATPQGTVEAMVSEMERLLKNGDLDNFNVIEMEGLSGYQAIGTHRLTRHLSESQRNKGLRPKLTVSEGSREWGFRTAGYATMREAEAVKELARLLSKHDKAFVMGVVPNHVTEGLNNFDPVWPQLVDTRDAVKELWAGTQGDFRDPRTIEIIAEMYKSMIREHGISGFRVDSMGNIPDDAWPEIASRIKEEFPNFQFMGENGFQCLSTCTPLGNSTPVPDHLPPPMQVLHSSYEDKHRPGAGAFAEWNANLARLIAAIANEKQFHNFAPEKAMDALEELFGNNLWYGSPSHKVPELSTQLVLGPGSHDNAREAGARLKVEPNIQGVYGPYRHVASLLPMFVSPRFLEQKGGHRGYSGNWGYSADVYGVLEPDGTKLDVKEHGMTFPEAYSQHRPSYLDDSALEMHWRRSGERKIRSKDRLREKEEADRFATQHASMRELHMHHPALSVSASKDKDPHLKWIDVDRKSQVATIARLDPTGEGRHLVAVVNMSKTPVKGQRITLPDGATYLLKLSATDDTDTMAPLREVASDGGIHTAVPGDLPAASISIYERQPDTPNSQ